MEIPVDCQHLELIPKLQGTVRVPLGCLKWVLGHLLAVTGIVGEILNEILNQVGEELPVDFPEPRRIPVDRRQLLLVIPREHLVVAAE